jgi:hypothetical protein
VLVAGVVELFGGGGGGGACLFTWISINNQYLTYRLRLRGIGAGGKMALNDKDGGCSDRGCCGTSGCGVTVGGGGGG